MSGLRCDLLITPHPGASKFIERMEGQGALIGRGQCVDYAAEGARNLDARLAKEARR